MVKKCGKCSKQPRYNLPGKKGGIFCKDHKSVQMIDVVTRTCQTQGCNIQPSFNNPGECRGKFCKSHKTAAMVDVKSRKCERIGCNKLNPVYNFDGNRRGRFCSEHKMPGMMDIRNRKCQGEGCRKYPLFNLPGETNGKFCKDHKISGMVDVRNRKCEGVGCAKQPSFNFPDSIGGRFCKDHKHPGMVDVINKICESFGCNTRSWYGLPGHRDTRCAEHREEGMISNPLILCMEDTCKEPAIFGHNRAIHCTIHKTPTEQNLIGKKCSDCGLIDVVDGSGRCKDCNPITRDRNRLSKQREVRDMLVSGGHGDFSYDRTIDRGDCGKERPDFMWDCGTHMLVVENDEWQHKDRIEWCECSRMVNISQSAGMAVLFLRYNPDPYYTGGVKHNPTMGKRRSTLLWWVDHLRKVRPPHFIGIVKLYFDGYNENDTKVECLVPFEGEIT